VDKNTKLVLYYSTKLSKEDVWCDLNAILKELQRLKEDKGVDYELKDTSNMTDEELYDAYMKAAMPSVIKKFKIRRIFGTRKSSGVFFGRQVPALLVYEGDLRFPMDVYPKVERGKQVSIEDFLKELNKVYVAGEKCQWE
jgi:hypothetical protein